MSKQRLEDSYSDLEEKESVSLPPIAAEESYKNPSDDTGISRRRVMEKENRYEHLIQEVERQNRVLDECSSPPCQGLLIQPLRVGPSRPRVKDKRCALYA